VIERHTAPVLYPPPGYAHAVAATGGRLVQTAGAVPLDADGQLVGPGDYVAQATRTMANLEVALAQGGAAPAHVIKLTVYVVAGEAAPLGDVWAVVRASSFPAAASTLLGVSALGYDDQLVEIEALAVVPLES
jgi:enamine deaminase RidA (YjgF/YER057c/UK114 family)